MRLRSLPAFALVAILAVVCRSNSKSASLPFSLSPDEQDQIHHKLLLMPPGLNHPAREPFASIQDMALNPSHLLPLGDEANAKLRLAPINCASFRPGELMPLSCVAVPRPSRSDIRNQQAAIVLGKALFWDTQVGSDGITACASCHALSGVDLRRVNSINPGPDGIFASNGVNSAGQILRLSYIKSDDRVGSAGVVKRPFLGIHSDPGVAEDLCGSNQDSIFAQERQVTGRNTPSTIGAVYYRQLFWDGRASHEFNGNDPFGKTANAGLPAALCDSCALASMALGPTNNDSEMSCSGRPFNGPGSLAAKLLPRIALAQQKVAPTDAVLGVYANSEGLGMICDQLSRRACRYQELIDLAFDPEIAGAHALANFSRIWGQALQAYQSTLIPSQTPYDAFLEGQAGALSERQSFGLSIFKGKAHCIECHNGAELSDASWSAYRLKGAVTDDGEDTGFHNLGLRPSEEDLGRAAPGPQGALFAESKGQRNRGAFKTPMLRNVRFTAPYFHHGGAPTLADVIRFYDRGGDFPDPNFPEIKPLGLNPMERAALFDFLHNALTDSRVEESQAPFDHPSLPFPSGVTLQEIGAAGGPSVFFDSKGRRVPSPDAP